MGEHTDETELLRILSGDPAPSLEQRAIARRRLDGELLADRHASRRPALRWLAFAVAVGATVLTSGFFLFNAASEAPQDLTPTLAYPAGPDPTESTYSLYVESVRKLDPAQLPDGAVIRTEQTITELSLDSDGPAEAPVAMISRKRIEGTWMEGRGVLVTVEGPPTPYGSDLDVVAGGRQRGKEERVTTASTLDMLALPIGRVPLEVAFDELLDSNQQQPRDVQLFQLVETLNKPSQVLSPAFRAAVLDILGRLDLNQSWYPNGTMSLTMTYFDIAFGEVAQTLTFDSNGYLIRSSTVTIGGLPQYGVPSLAELRVVAQSPPAIGSL
ncbi:MAG: hypothetical protein BMS9Abin17_0365 [Acidimicrobiia bacterium]|nr:MAG: hypothetical protein BMS9Abin17_0365 [Acidimicrobiia bacterium]